jgi:hypothetical protein
MSTGTVRLSLLSAFHYALPYYRTLPLMNLGTFFCEVPQDPLCTSMRVHLPLTSEKNPETRTEFLGEAQDP